MKSGQKKKEMLRKGAARSSSHASVNTGAFTSDTMETLSPHNGRQNVVCVCMCVWHREGGLLGTEGGQRKFRECKSVGEKGFWGCKAKT